jgi:hypothetical protein
MIRRMLHVALALAGLTAFLALTGGPVQRGAAQVAPEVELTVYNDNSALVKERRQITLTRGLNSIMLNNVAAGIKPTSVLLAATNNATNIQLLEQSYQYDVASSSTLLARYLDQPIQITTENGASYSGTLLSAAADVIIARPDGQVVIVKESQVQQFSLPALEAGLVTDPTLAWEVEANRAGRETFELTYVTQGLNWYANYVGLVSPDEKRMQLKSWITLENNTGASYREARLNLVANTTASPGPKMQAQPQAQLPDRSPGRLQPTPQTTPVQGLTQASRPEFQVYQIPRPVTITDQEIKQLNYLRVDQLPVTKMYLYDGGSQHFPGYLVADPATAAGDSETGVYVAFEISNTQTSGLGLPLPAGQVQLYSANTGQAIQVVNENRIEHTDKDERLRLRANQAMDLIGQRVPTDFKRVGDNVIQESFAITLRNASARPVEVRVIEHLFRWSNWHLTAESQKSTKLDNETIEYRVTVPANGETQVTYTVQYDF